jgi:NitT/TauT family transport system permease protein
MQSRLRKFALATRRTPSAPSPSDGVAAVTAFPAAAPNVPVQTTLTQRTLTLFLRRRRSLLSFLFGCLSLVFLLAVWHFATKYKIEAFIRFTNIPSPIDVFNDATTIVQTSRFQKSVAISTRRIFIGFGIATVLGVALGMLIGRFRVMRELTFPALEVLRPIPAIAWVPMSIMLWPTNEVSIIFITFLGSFFPILLNTIHGVEALDQVLVRAANSLGAHRLALFWYVMLPGALPHIFTGLAVGMGVAWVSLIAAEMISGQFGIGYFTWEAYSLVNYREIVLGMIVIGTLGLACSGLIRLLARFVMPWQGLRSAQANR